MRDTYVYPAVFVKVEEEYQVYFPDLDGCVSAGDSLEEAVLNARGALSLHLFGMEQDGDEIPEPTNPKIIPLDEDEVAVMLDVYMPTYREKMLNKSINKTLTLPKWLNDEAERHGVNFSQTLQQALKEKLTL